MDMVVLIYLFFLATGVLWVTYKVVTHIFLERRRDSRLKELFSEEEFRAYVRSVKVETGRTNPAGAGSVTKEAV
ncbi:MAG: hypothetical protein V2B18_08620 [Pseudomonadota bacterium]